MYGNAPGTDDVLESLGLVRDERTEKLAGALAEQDLSAALEIAREVASDGLDIARFTRETIDTLRERLLVAARERAPEVGVLTSAVAELAGADFRRDPGSPVPLEVACAAAVLGPAQPAAAPAPAGANGQPARGGQRPQRRPQGRRRDPANESREERFLRELYERCRMTQPALAAWLNGSCEVLTMDGDELRLGFYHPIHMQKIDNDGRTLVEQKAEELLQRPVTLAVERIERSAPASRPARGGHLAAAAREMGAKPVESAPPPRPRPPEEEF